jgi:hypothetical protein
LVATNQPQPAKVVDGGRNLMAVAARATAVRVEVRVVGAKATGFALRVTTATTPFARSAIAAIVNRTEAEEVGVGVVVGRAAAGGKVTGRAFVAI